jgi:predicted DNA-binding protein (MmcQ/YjbR family)
MRRGASRPNPFHALCRTLPGVTEDVKWGADLVFSVGGKMFAVFPMGEHEERGFSFKVEAMVFEALTRRKGIVPAPYLARASWIKVQPAALPKKKVEALLRESWRLVAERLPKKQRAALFTSRIQL